MLLPSTLLFAALLSACGVKSSTSPPIPPPAPLDLTGNWQIQSNTPIPPAIGAPSAVLLLGSLQSTGSQVSGTFRLADLATSDFTHCGSFQTLSLTGHIDTNNLLTLASAPFQGSVLSVSVPLSSTAESFQGGTLAITGPTCAFPSTPAIGLRIPTATGTYAGTLTPLSTSSSTQTGTAKLSITQSARPDPDGQFPLTGTLQFTAGACNTTLPLTGTISGVLMKLASNPLLPPGPPWADILFVAAVLPNQPTLATIAFDSAPCSTSVLPPVVYQGNLTRQ